MIKTSYEIQICIDEDEFNLVINEPGEREKKLLDIKKQAKQKELDKLELCRLEYEEKIKDITEKNEIISLNLEIAKELKGDEKLAVLNETKELKKQIFAIQKILKEPDFKPLEQSLEELLKYKSDLLISGDNKEEFISIVNEKSISHKLIWEEISLKVAQASQKKL